MTRIIQLLFLTISFNVIAETDLSSIEEQERQQIIKELTFSLNTQQNCTQTLMWDDSGSGADLDGYFFTPTVKKTEYIIGGHASQKRRSKYHCVTTVSEPTTNPKEAPKLLVAPKDWKQVWKDSGSGATRDGAFWKAIPPDNNYRCIGSVSQVGHNNKPNIPNYRCVHARLTEKINSSAIVWSSKGTGSDKQVTIFGLPNTGAFTAIAKQTNQTAAYDLRKNASSVPDAKTVEEILAKRMAPIRADIEAKAKALQEQKQAAAEAELKKAEAEAAEKKKLAEAAEKKRKAAEAEKKMIWEKEEAKRLAEAEAAKQAEQAKVEEEIEQLEIPEPKVEVEEPVEEVVKQEPVKEEKTIEELIPDIPEVEETPVASTETSNTSEPKSGSKSFDDLLNTFLKVLALMFGGLVFMVLLFKFVIGSKKGKDA